ncbi:MAG: hypothetical protein CMJ32_06845 [Phycisphaerae bacterium]|nr:hypothetical protein [Phycisphaerae bacterium]
MKYGMQFRRHISSVFVLGFLILLAVGSMDSSSNSKPKTQEELRKERLSDGFSGWGGSHLALAKLIKAGMNNPESYDHVETVYWDNGDHLIVKTTFRGTNAFGGVVTNWVRAKTDLDGNVLEVIDQGP